MNACSPKTNDCYRNHFLKQQNMPWSQQVKFKPHLQPLVWSQTGRRFGLAPSGSH